MKKFKGKYRTESTRLQNWDYSGNGFYFITLVTYGRVCHFGDIIDGKMILNDFGKIASDEWYNSFKLRKEINPRAFVLMPNHLHAIVGIKSSKHLFQSNDLLKSVDLQSIEMNGSSPKYGVAIRKPKSISSFVAGFKSAVINKIDDLIDEQNLSIKKFNRRNPLWQSNYHDSIIRDRGSYERIMQYIQQNPEKWNEG